MENLNAIYTDIIMEHNSSCHNKKCICDADVNERGYNPSCGDDITLSIKFDGDVIEDAAFSGVGCAISQASTSIMIDLIKGKTVVEAMEYVEGFLGMIKDTVKNEEVLEKLEDAIAFRSISKMPARVKCAVLAWRTLEEIISSTLSK